MKGLYGEGFLDILIGTLVKHLKTPAVSADSESNFHWLFRVVKFFTSRTVEIR